MLNHAGSLTFNRRVTIASQEGQHLESIGSYTIDSNSAYLVVQDQESLKAMTLYHIQFDADTYATKTATLAYEITGTYIKFKQDDLFYLGGLIQSLDEAAEK